MVNYNDYVYAKKINLNTAVIKQSCMLLRRNVIKKIINNQGESTVVGEKGPKTTQLYTGYNLLLHPYDGFHELYHEIKNMFWELQPINKYYMQCWLNYYNPGEYADWHWHYPAGLNCWHGFYCLDVGQSKTTYIFEEKQFDITGENNMLIIGRSENDRHRTYPQDSVRITIAFDIVPQKYIQKNGMLINHWIPL
jgi:hypothetical protein